MKKLIILLVIPILLLTACESDEVTCSNFLLADSDISNQEEYLIIEAILNEQFENSNLSHISQQTHFMADSLRFSRYFEYESIELEADMITDYIELNSVPFKWDNLFNTEQGLIPEEELVCFFENDSWTGYYSEYPDANGFFRFGKPIQNEKNEALVTFEFYCNWKCGSGYTVTLRREEGEWKVKNFINVWIS